MNYYNEIDPFAAQWLRNLIEAGHLPQGDVDARSIVDVRPGDLRGYKQCHFFAGIGGWPYALGLAGWPDDKPVWTGSCPCQPFSVAGEGKGTDDERHLWPAFRRLITECRPSVVFGEQIAGQAGQVWLAGVRADLEAIGYAVGAADLAAASIGAPHIRQRLYWIADANPHRIRLETHADQDDLCRSVAQAKRDRRFSEVGPSGQWDTPRPAGARPMALGNGIPGDLGALKGYGNAIVPPLAAEFVMAFRDTVGG